ncbi:unnamed protein product [Lactuca saligna]|uniref:Uncharacterized protein n=1 Tax=Lactuca saligna TaxID=75948 RepID=A0AA35ZC07_LACSI|nr:unnamed protein product [Lactuca saligna]
MKEISSVTKSIIWWLGKSYADWKIGHDDHYDYAPTTMLEGDGEDDDVDYDYAPTTSEGDVKQRWWDPDMVVYEGEIRRGCDGVKIRRWCQWYWWLKQWLKVVVVSGLNGFQWGGIQSTWVKLVVICGIRLM